LAEAVQQHTALPVFTGSGVTLENAATFLQAGHGVITGSSLKAEGDWRNPVDPQRVRAFVQAALR
jgi:predicted TIM-barrel enzyme